jgi:hypothetical protein
MKKLLGIVVLGLIICSSAFANDMIGKKIVCGEWASKTEIISTKLPLDGYHFISKKKVMVYQMSDPGTGFYTDKRKYKLYSDEVVIKMSKGFEFNINRTSGIRRANNLKGTDVICRPLSDEKDMKKMFNKIHQFRLSTLKNNQKF